MRYDPPLIPARLTRRYKRFLADVVLADGTEITVHCANPGSMLGLTRKDARVWISDSQNPKRKLRYSLELVEVGGALVGVHTGRTNTLAGEAIKAGKINELCGYDDIRTEVKYGTGSRVDFVLQSEGRPPCFVEVKSVTLSRQPGLAEFPDSVTKRGARHMNELANEARKGNRAVLLYIIQRDDCARFSPAQDIDPAYALAFEEAQKDGVEILVYACAVSSQAITISNRIV